MAEQLRHWIETTSYNERYNCYEEGRKEISESDIEKLKNGEITHSGGEEGKFYFYERCVGYRLFDAVADGEYSPVVDIDGGVHHNFKPSGDRKNETGWTFFKEKIDEAKAKVGWVPKMSEEDVII